MKFKSLYLRMSSDFSICVLLLALEIFEHLDDLVYALVLSVKLCTI